MRNVGVRGFTLIELLIVVVIIGILAAIAIPKFGATKERAYIAAMKSDLRNMATAQDGYLFDNQVYTTAFTTGVFRLSAGVSTYAVAATTGGWMATVAHEQTNVKCYIFGGSAYTANGPATREGTAACQ
ncbi:MAG TPA: prepilin-type N-terminal cleavage/methylation domain-containing protein [Gemmatimonadales bacterium]|jgi:prepilin-type N-terminal cleavage/methylation domain-containing protein